MEVVAGDRGCDRVGLGLATLHEDDTKGTADAISQVESDDRKMQVKLRRLVTPSVTPTANFGSVLGPINASFKLQAILIVEVILVGAPGLEPGTR